MNYTISDFGPFVRVVNEVGDTMIHKSFIRNIKTVGDSMVKLETEDPLHSIYIDYLFVTDPSPLSSNLELRNIIASWVMNTE